MIRIHRALQTPKTERAGQKLSLFLSYAVSFHFREPPCYIGKKLQKIEHVTSGIEMVKHFEMNFIIFGECRLISF